MFFSGAIFMLIYLDKALGVSYKHVNIILPLNEEVVITSPGYPNRDYNKDTKYTWDVRANDAAEKISLTITMDIEKTPGYSCVDYLQIQEINPSTGNFTVFKQCGNITDKRIARGNRLLVTLISNSDTLTSRGFQLVLQVMKIGTTQSKATLPTITTKITTTTPPPVHVKTTAKKTVPLSTTAQKTPSTAKSSTAKATTRKLTTKVSLSTTLTTSKMITTTTTMALITNATTSMKSKSPLASSATTTKLTTTKTIPTTTDMALMTNATTLIQSMSPLISSAATSEYITSDGKTTTSKKEISTASSSYQTTPGIRIQPTQSSPSQTRNITTTLDTFTRNVTDKDSGSFLSFIGSLGMNTVILLIGLGILEVTLIVVGVLAVKRYRLKRKYNTSKQTSKRQDDHPNTFDQQNGGSDINVYEEINIDDVKEAEEENPYKELPEGVYDTTLKRRSYLKVVEERKSKYSRGSVINMFRTSSFFRRKVNETSVMTFSSFKGPVQTTIGEKSNR